MACSLAGRWTLVLLLALAPLAGCRSGGSAAGDGAPAGVEKGEDPLELEELVRRLASALVDSPSLAELRGGWGGDDRRILVALERPLDEDDRERSLPAFEELLRVALLESGRVRIVGRPLAGVEATRSREPAAGEREARDGGAAADVRIEARLRELERRALAPGRPRERELRLEVRALAVRDGSLLWAGTARWPAASGPAGR